MFGTGQRHDERPGGPESQPQHDGARDPGGGDDRGRDDGSAFQADDTGRHQGCRRDGGTPQPRPPHDVRAPATSGGRSASHLTPDTPSRHDRGVSTGRRRTPVSRPGVSPAGHPERTCTTGVCCHAGRRTTREPRGRTRMKQQRCSIAAASATWMFHRCCSPAARAAGPRAGATTDGGRMRLAGFPGLGGLRRGTGQLGPGPGCAPGCGKAPSLMGACGRA